jgi:hypothetical protein
MTAAVLLVAAALALTPGGPSTPGSPEHVDLVAGSTSSARVEVPYPGHSTAFDVTARAAAGAGPSDLALLLDGGTGPLADGPDALRITLTDATGTVLAEGTTAELRDRPIPLGTLGTQPVTVHGAAELPASAGDAAQAAGLSLTFRLVAESDAAVPTRSQVLATTGARALAVTGVAAALVTTGLLLLAARRRTKEDS